MNVANLWATPVATSMAPGLSAQTVETLVALLLQRDADTKKVPASADAFKEFVDSGDFYHAIHYNLFEHQGRLPESDALNEFEAFACKQVREYLRLAFDANDSESVELSARCFGHVHSENTRTFPHYHQGSDVVLIHYLRADSDQGRPLSLIMQDPRGAPNYPWWGKMHTINPVSGMTVCHPSFLWHETNEWRGTGARVLMAANFKVVGHGHEKQFKATKF